MKLFKKYNRLAETGKYHLNTLLGFGNHLRVKHHEATEISETGMQMTSITHLLESEGWFVRIELPFTRTVTYTDPNDFFVKHGKCRPTWLISKRTNRKGQTFKNKIFMWLPLEFINEKPTETMHDSYYI